MAGIETATGPGTTCDVSKSSPGRSVTIAASSNYPGLLIMPSTGTYGNGVTMASANYGDSNIAEGEIEQLDIPGIHPQSNTPYDKTTAFSTGDVAWAIKHKIGKTYWVKGSSVTASVGAKLYSAGSGLVAVQTAHTASPLPHHTWVCVLAASSATWIKVKYIGITSMYTANS